MMTADSLPLSAITLGQLLEGFADTGNAAGLPVSGLSMDSRKVAEGDLFLACSGTRYHGASFVNNAVRQGVIAVAFESSDDGQEWLGDVMRYNGRSVPIFAVPELRRKAGIIAARFFGHPADALELVGVTGTNGKTSISHFVAQALSSRAPCGVVGTLGSGLYGELEETGHTTPGPVELQAQLAAMRQRGATHAVLEVSSHALDQGRVAGSRFATAIFSNLTHEHLDYHGDMASYAKAKWRLFNLPGLRSAVINVDDPVGRQWAEELTDSPLEVITYGLEPGGKSPTLFGRDLHLDTSGLSLAIRSPYGERELKTALLGRFNASNLLAALGALIASGWSLDDAVTSLGGATTVPGRMERFGGGTGEPLVVVDYAHTPDALEHVLSALREHCCGELWCLFGCGGERDRRKRPLMGAVAERMADRVVLTDDNPRGEDPFAIIEEILKGLGDPDGAYVIRDRGEAIARALSLAKPGDVVLVAGKGHEGMQLFANRAVPFSDRDEVARLLEARHG